MKVSSIDSDLNAKLAYWLGFLRAARKITFQSLAQAHGTQRSNLSAFVTSAGKIRNISLDKIRSVLFDLGVLADGALTPGLHRWAVTEEMIPGMLAVLSNNPAERVFVFELGSGYGVFVVVQVAANILMFASLPADSTKAVVDGLPCIPEKIRVITLDRAGDSQIQALWMTNDDSAVSSNLLTLMG